MYLLTQIDKFHFILTISDWICNPKEFLCVKTEFIVQIYLLYYNFEERC